MGFQHPDISAFPEFSLVIGEERARSGNGIDWGHVYPGTGRITREIRLASPDDVDRAVVASKAAHPAWRALPGDRRRDLMFRLASLMEAGAAEMTPLLTAENGSILIAGGHMSPDAAQKFRHFGGWADKVEWSTGPT